MTLLTRGLLTASAGMVVLILFGGCVSTNIGISYTSQSNAAPVAEAARAPVIIDVQDERLKKPVGTVYSSLGEYGGDFTYTIHATNDIATVVKEAFTEELAKRGFTPSENGVKILVGVNKFYGDSIRAGATLTISVQVRKPDGTVVYSKLVTATGKYRRFTLDTGLIIQGKLNNALNNCMTQLFADQSFVEELLKASGDLASSGHDTALSNNTAGR